ncbi:hypothetical protein JCM11491_000947 [Sporobolomyces phaffii]
MRSILTRAHSSLAPCTRPPRTVPNRTARLSHSTASTSVQSAARMRIAKIDAQLETRSPSVSPFLVDSFGRQHDYLRISLTEKCNLRCTYCMPSTGVPLLPRDDLLTTDEVERVAKLFVENGVTKIRLTGGEPTVRKDLVDVVARISSLKPRIESLGITSNGVTLRRHLPALVDAGLTHLNISLDTLDEHKYELMTRRRAYGKVMDTLEVAKRLRDTKGLRVKLNVVVIAGLNDMEVPDFVELGKAENLAIRFIEYMPFADNRWSTKKLVPSTDLLSRVQMRYPDSPIDKVQDSPSDTTRAYRIRGFEGSFGFISSMTDHFCGTCSRLRVGADGGVKVCLFGPPALSLRPLLRSLPSTPENDLLISQKIGETVWGKKYAHNGLGDHSIEITCRATCEGKTGVEMEALTGVSVAGLTVWDMCKAVAGEEMTLGEIKVVEKTGGRSGDWKRTE